MRPAEKIEIDVRDWNAWRDRIIDIEQACREAKEENARLRSLVLGLQGQFALMMQGTRERMDYVGLLLSELEAKVARKDLG